MEAEERCSEYTKPILKYTSVSRQKGQIKPFSLPRLSLSLEQFRFPLSLRQWRRPQPVSIYPVALQLMCSRVEPSPPLPLGSPPHRPPPISALFPHLPLPFPPPLSLSLSLSLFCHTETHPTQDLGFASTREYFSLSFSRDPSPCFSCLVLPQRENSLSLSVCVEALLSVLFVSTLRIPDVLFVPLSFPLVSSFLFRRPPTSSAAARVCSLFVLEIRSGLPNPLFSCAVINYYLLAIHPSRIPNELYREIKSLLWNFVFATILSPPPASSIMGLNFGGGEGT